MWPLLPRILGDVVRLSRATARYGGFVARGRDQASAAAAPDLRHSTGHDHGSVGWKLNLDVLIRQVASSLCPKITLDDELIDGLLRIC